MKLSQLCNRKWNDTALCFLFPALGFLVVMICSSVIPFGKNSMLFMDMWHQYYPFFLSLRKTLLSGGSLLYNWDIGMGIDYLGLIAYYLASPLNLIVVLVPESWMLACFSLLTPIKLGFAGLFFGIFLKKVFGKDDIFVPLFSCFYALCAWAIGYRWNIMWLDTFALLPLVILGEISLLKQRKFLLYTLTLCLSLFANYYVGYFTCIFVLLVFACYEICNCRSVKRFFTDLGLMAVFSGIAIGMSMILFLPGLAALQSTQSSAGRFPTGFALNIVSSDLQSAAVNAWDAYKTAGAAGENTFGLWWIAVWKSFVAILNGMRQVAGNVGGGLSPTFSDGLPNLYCGVGTIVLAFLFLTSRQVKVREKICSVVLLLFLMLSFLVRQLDYIWHGFHFTNQIPYRFSFLFSFVMLCMAYRAFRMRRRFQLWQLIAASLLTVGLLLCSASRTDPVYIVYNGVFFLVYMALLVWENLDGKLPRKEDREGRELYMADRKQRRRYATLGLAVVLALEVVMNLVNFVSAYDSRSFFVDISDYPTGTDYTASMVRYMQEDDDPYYRAEMAHNQTLNDSALNGYAGISTFTSSANVKVTDFMNKLGYAARKTFNRYTYEDSSPVANLFLNLKYIIERNRNVEESPYFSVKHSYQGITLMKNEAYLPLGFLAETKLGDLKFNLYGNTFLFQNFLFKAATGMEDNVWSVLAARCLTVEPGETNVLSSSAAGQVNYDNGDKATDLTYRYTIGSSGYLCLDMEITSRDKTTDRESSNNWFAVKKNGVEVDFEQYLLPQTLAIGQVERGDVIEVIIKCRANEKGSVDIRTGLLNEDVFWEGYEVLAASTLELTTFTDTYVEGVIDCNRDGLLYTSVPQNGNWSVTVDGEPAEIILVGNAMISVELTEGSHTVCFIYENRSFSLGWKISLVSCAALAVICAVVYRKKIGSCLRKLKK